MTPAQIRNERAYILRSEGYSNSEVAELLGTEGKRVPTMVKAHLALTGAEPFEGCKIVCDPAVGYGKKKTVAEKPSKAEEKGAPDMIGLLEKLIADNVGNREIGRVVRAMLK